MINNSYLKSHLKKITYNNRGFIEKNIKGFINNNNKSNNYISLLSLKSTYNKWNINSIGGKIRNRSDIDDDKLLNNIIRSLNVLLL